MSMDPQSIMDIQEEVIKTAYALGVEKNEKSLRFTFYDINANVLKTDALPDAISILTATSQGKVNALLKKRTTESFTSNVCYIVSCILCCTLCCGYDFPVKGPVVTELPDKSTVIFVITGAGDANVDVEIATEALRKHQLPVRLSLELQE